MNIKSIIFSFLVCVGSVARADFVHYIPACEHNTLSVGGWFERYGAHICPDAATNAPFHKHIASLANSPLVNTCNDTIVYYMTYAGTTAKKAILDILIQNPNAHGNEQLKNLINQEIERQKQVALENAQACKVLAGTVCVVACIALAAYVYDCCKEKPVEPLPAMHWKA